MISDLTLTRAPEFRVAASNRNPAKHAIFSEKEGQYLSFIRGCGAFCGVYSILSQKGFLPEVDVAPDDNCGWEVYTT